MELVTPYDGVPRNAVKRMAKRVFALATETARAVPGYGLIARAVDTLTGADGIGWQRKVMYQETVRLVEQLQPEKLDALEISGDRWGTLVKFKTFKSVDFPEYDLCAAPLAEKFDLVIADQVFEHLLWPYRAGKNAYEMVRPGGHFLVMTPFLVRVHAHPTDCSRWTETGLRHLLAECGFPLELIRTGSWGNLSCVRADLKRFRKYRRYHSLRDQHQYPIQVWALATKPL
ncbi:MAG TPA: methyltransferase domain-containing protein [Gemmatimonadaceae bacterium]|jgi:SAM-dependent methyltransferase|nr:methyltransferase domain-containing protein [Gemmatimonadaceae bacterium]